MNFIDLPDHSKSHSFSISCNVSSSNNESRPYCPAGSNQGSHLHLPKHDIPEEQQFKFIKKSVEHVETELGHQRLTLTDNKTIAGRFTSHTTEPSSPLVTKSLSPSRPFKHVQSSRLEQPLGDVVSKAELSSFTKDKSEGRLGCPTEKSSSAVWSFGQYQRLGIRSKNEFSSSKGSGNPHLNFSSQVLSGLESNDQGMPIDTIIDIESLLIKDEDFMRYLEVRETQYKNPASKLNNSKDLLTPNYLLLPLPQPSRRGDKY